MSENPYAAPESILEPETASSGSPSMVLASRWARLGAAILDGLISFVAFIPLLIALLLLGLFPGMPKDGAFMENLENMENSIMGDLVAAWIYVIVYLVINGYLLVSSGQSIGKKIVGIRIVDCQNGQLLPASRVIGMRYLLLSLITQIPFAGGVFGLVDVLFIFRADKRCIHDLMAKSCVVNA